MNHPREKRDYGVRKTSVVAILGVVVVAAAGIFVINWLTGSESKTVGLGDFGIGREVAPFAIADVTSDLEGDANVDAGEACTVAERGAIRVCDFFDRPLVISFWFTRGAARCVDVQDDLDRIAARYRGRLGVLSVNVLDSRERVEEIVRERGWKMAVGHDRDGAVANLFRVGGCPTFLFVARGGVLVRAEAGETDARRLDAQVRSFLDGQEEAQGEGEAAQAGSDG